MSLVFENNEGEKFRYIKMFIVLDFIYIFKGLVKNYVFLILGDYYYSIFCVKV